ncbi:Glycosyl transferase, family 8, partial [Dillenia turbinata]
MIIRPLSTPAMMVMKGGLRRLVSAFRGGLKLKLKRERMEEEESVWHKESSKALKEPEGFIYTPIQNSSSNATAADSARALSAAHGEGNNENPIRQVTDQRDRDTKLEPRVSDEENKDKQQSAENSSRADMKDSMKTQTGKPNEQIILPDVRVQQLKDQLIRAKVYLSLALTRNNPHFTRELHLRMKEVQRALGDATKDSDLPRNANEKLKAMEQTLAKGKQIQDDCAAVVKKLRAILHSMEEQLRVHKKQTMFLTQLTAKTLPKGLHCLPLRLSADYFILNTSEHHFPNEEKLEEPKLYHRALFSHNVLAAAVVVNSTVSHAKDPSKHVFHIVTDRLNYAAMRMWFIANAPGKATIQVQSVEEFTWFNSSYSPVIRQLDSPLMIDYYFRASRASSSQSLIREERGTGSCSTLDSGVQGSDAADGMRTVKFRTLGSPRRYLGTLPPGLITFWNRTYPLDRTWHVLGLGYNPNVNLKEIDRAAVIHYNGNMKPWLEIAIPKYRNYWAKYVDYDH